MARTVHPKHQNRTHIVSPLAIMFNPAREYVHAHGRILALRLSAQLRARAEVVQDAI